MVNVMPQPFEWCPIPAGRVTLQNVPEGTYDVAAFDLGRYPVTMAQFKVFVEASDGYPDAGWWDFSPQARRWRAYGEPGESAFAGDDLPCLMVNWHEAMAFCRWLSASTGQALSLPTEQEWQRAAQGDDERLYPWGHNYEPGRGNSSESGIKRPTPVTQFPNGASPYRVIDMSGNVSEWCLNAYNAPGDDDVLGGSAARTIRGGSWGLSHFTAMTTFRGFEGPTDRYDYLSFRLARRSG